MDVTGERNAAKGTVVYVEPNMGFAMRFRQLDASERAELTKVIEALKGGPQ